ncbi:hypothetical protein [Catellatospora chokoriensis]|uniref:Uncharacterized protein n=1 Tax=Catellatospora chokoriensis TaxID=310353 RepID=A0A8J3NSK3_9ACTN|nr:hypothetical protein [Catellatospora chokoriensis]GIF90641.1 hypothetical protein Cch02nite_40850 [Catellatospora chokoriensis]
MTLALEPVTQLPQAMLLPTMAGHLAELGAAVSQCNLRNSKQAYHVHETAVALSALCTPRPAPLTI